MDAAQDLVTDCPVAEHGLVIYKSLEQQAGPRAQC